MARAVKKGEKIDFFLSHSWHDDAYHKWERLKEISAEFFGVHGRYPTFWLDIVCIDQDAIADGLRVLPLNIMACRQVLALVGKTYVCRLWCVWELFTVFAFAAEEAARSRIHFAPLCEASKLGSQEDPSQALKAFSLGQAHCYDPNEEMRLLEIIETIGAPEFERRIWDLSNTCLR